MYSTDISRFPVKKRIVFVKAGIVVAHQVITGKAVIRAADVSLMPLINHSFNEDETPVVGLRTLVEIPVVVLVFESERPIEGCNCCIDHDRVPVVIAVRAVAAVVLSVREVVADNDISLRNEKQPGVHFFLVKLTGNRISACIPDIIEQIHVP